MSGPISPRFERSSELSIRKKRIFSFGCLQKHAGNVPDDSGRCLAKFAVESQFHRMNMLIYTPILEWTRRTCCSQAISDNEPLVFISGQTPRAPDGQRLIGAAFEQQVRVVLDNVEAVARASGLSLLDAMKVDVFLKDLGDRAAFDAIYATYIGKPAPARTLVQSNFTEFDVEVSAVLRDRI